jgi:hypothetical protein
MFKLSYENPPFIMGWGIGEEISNGSASASVGASIGLSLGISIPLPYVLIPPTPPSSLSRKN